MKVSHFLKQCIQIYVKMKLGKSPTMPVFNEQSNYKLYKDLQ